jgi:flavin reductase (DIM6/NTAB) family NADH-FMN oxidoreductase RutF
MKKFPLKKAFTFIEPGPVTMITTFDGKKNNIMTISWNMVMDFTPQFAILTGPWNHSYKALVKTKECVISIPSVAISQKVIKIGACSGKDTDKFKKFNLTPLKAKYVKASLIKESLANIECRVADHIKKHNIFVLDGIAAWFNDKIKEKRMFHAAGDGTFTVDGRRINHKKLMLNKLPDGV